MPKFIDLSGRQIHDWFVIQKVNVKKGRTHWFCKCKCGKNCFVDGAHLLGNRSTKCKTCHNKEAVKKRSMKHGNCKGEHSKEYISWVSMKTRCLNRKSDHWKNYGGRGINICDEWKNDFASFKRDMGICPEKCTLERIDNEQGYSKTNCVWATHKQQSENKRTNIKLILNGITKTKTQWAKDYGIPYTSFSRMIKKMGWPLPAPPEVKR